MTSSLEIRDGNPYWWLSPDIWVVPGNDPGGPPGAPVAGSPAFLWARVHNIGTDPVMGARVDFWWADPSAQILRSTAHPIGSAYADIQPGDTQEVLCLTPWPVQLVNGGHECVVASVDYFGSSVPTPPPDDFGPTLYVEVAQRNLQVVDAAQAMKIRRLIALSATNRRDKVSLVTIEMGGELPRDALADLGLAGYRPAAGAKVQIGLALDDDCDAKTQARLELKLGRGEQRAVYAHIEPVKIAPGEYALAHVLEHVGDKLVGGYSFALAGANPEKRNAK